MAHIILIEWGLRELAPPGVEQFVLVVDADKLGLGQFDPALMKQLLGVMVTGYPERVGKLYIGPVNTLVRAVYRLISPLLPAGLKAKFVLMRSAKKELERHGVVAPDRVPDFFGGSFAHSLGKPGGEGEGGGEGQAGSAYDFEQMIGQQRALLAERLAAERGATVTTTMTSPSNPAAE